MLANLRNLFNPAAVVQSLAPLPPIASTIMNTFFKSRPTHPMPLIGMTDLTGVVQTVPVVRRDGTPVSLGNEELETRYVAPLPIKVKIPVTASELNDLRVMLGNTASVESWRARKVDQIRKTIHNTTEGMCTGVLTTGKVSWPVQLEGGRTETYDMDYGAPLSHTLTTKLSASTKLSELYALLRTMELNIRQAGLGGKVEFWAGSDVVSVLLDMVQIYTSTTDVKPIRVELAAGKVMVGSYPINFMDETHPDPLSGQWLPKLNAKVLMAVAVDVPGTVWYCAVDSISANNAAVPLHIVPVARDDDSGIMLIGQAKPLPARSSKTVCLCTAVA